MTNIVSSNFYEPTMKAKKLRLESYLLTIMHILVMMEREIKNILKPQRKRSLEKQQEDILTKEQLLEKKGQKQQEDN